MNGANRFTIERAPQRWVKPLPKEALTFLVGIGSDHQLSTYSPYANSFDCKAIGAAHIRCHLVFRHSIFSSLRKLCKAWRTCSLAENSFANNCSHISVNDECPSMIHARTEALSIVIDAPQPTYTAFAPPQSQLFPCVQVAIHQSNNRSSR